MKRFRAARAVALAVVAWAGVACVHVRLQRRSVAGGPGATDAATVLVEADRLASLNLWPGFDARRIPVALFDGKRTWLYGHPSPPSSYAVEAVLSGLLSRPGRDSLVVANSSVMLGGVRTATVVMSAAGASLSDRASTIIHERFHVFQIVRHPHWVANEVDLFVYPVSDGTLLALRRRESAALRRALVASTSGGAACFARLALDLRQRRFALMPPGAAAYERGSEWREGLANYVQARAAGFPGEALPAAEFRPEEVRQRTYASGLAFGQRLDRLAPSWRDDLERRDSVSLDSALGLAVAEATAGVCRFPDAERATIERRAESDAGALRSRLIASREAFVRRPGYGLNVIAGAEPLWPQGFDPLNVQVLAPDEVLHTRFLRLANGSGAVEVLGNTAMTTAAGDHPMFSGLRSVALTGLVAEPVTELRGDTVVVIAPGVRASFRGAVVARRDSTMIVTLQP